MGTQQLALDIKLYLILIRARLLHCSIPVFRKSLILLFDKSRVCKLLIVETLSRNKGEKGDSKKGEGEGRSE